MSEQYVLFAGDDAWAVARVRDGAFDVTRVALPADAPPERRLAGVKEALEKAGHAGQPVLLALPAAWCLCAPVSTEGLERGAGRRRALAFRLEEHLPISAEDFVADYVTGRDGKALGVCAELAPLEEIVRAATAAGIDIRHVCPAAFLAAAHAAEQHAGVGGVLLAGGGHAEAPPGAGVEFVQLDRARPTRWWWLADDAAAASDRLAQWAAELPTPPRLAVLGVAAGRPIVSRASRDIKVAEDPIAGAEAAARHAARILEGRASPWIDLRRDALAPARAMGVYRKPLLTLAAAAGLLVLSVLVVAAGRGRHYQRLRDGFLQQQVEVFRATLPNQRVPASVQSRLRSERQRLTGLQEASRKPGAATRSALAQLRVVLSSLAAEGRCRITDLTVQPDLVRVEGQAVGYADAERLAAALRQAGGYEVDAPKTVSLREGGVSFVFAAKPRVDAAALAQGEQP